MNKNITAFLLTQTLIPDGKPAISLINITKKGKSINHETTGLKWQYLADEIDSLQIQTSLKPASF